MLIVPKNSGVLDGLAIGASAACLVHCLLLPILIAVLPAASEYLGVPESFHTATFLFAVPASALAMRTGYRHHGIVLPAALALVGLVLLGVGALAGFRLFLETGVSVVGSLILAIGHLENWRLREKAFGALCETCNVVSSQP